MMSRAAATVRAALTLLVILPVRVYQVVLGPLLPKVCIYHPSCSDYFVLAVRKYGPMRGTCKGVWRICRCNPFSQGGYDPP